MLKEITVDEAELFLELGVEVRYRCGHWPSGETGLWRTSTITPSDFHYGKYAKPKTKIDFYPITWFVEVE